MDAERLAKLQKVIEANKVNNKTFNIVLNHIDPDSIGCGFALKHLLRHSGVPNARIRVLYVGEPGEEQNEMIIDRYSLTQHLLKLNEFWPTNNGNDVYALVDSSNPNDHRLGAVAGKINPIIVIDHHSNPAPVETEDSFIWIEQLGACSTMLVQLLQSLGLASFAKEANDDLFVPVLLALGIHADTHGMTAHITGDDLTAYTEVYRICDQKDLKALIQVQESPAYVAAEDYARSHRSQNGLRLVACAGCISGKKSVYIAKIINKMLNWRGVSVAVVYALTDDRRLIFSVRSTDITLHSPLNQILRREFGNSAGVKRSEDGSLLEGGGQIDLAMNFATDPETREKFLEVMAKHMENIFMSDELR